LLAGQGTLNMSVDLVSLKILTVFPSGQDRDLLRQGAGVATVPVDIVEAENAGTARSAIQANEVDIILLDAAIPADDRAQFIETARAARPKAFVIVVAGSDIGPTELSDAATGADGVLKKPANPEEAKALVGRCVRVRLPSRVLVVDDSATMRSIVRKILQASRFPMDVAEAEEGIAALQQVGSGKFDIVFLDYNMPGLNGVETLAEIKRQFPRLQVVMITSTQDEAVAEKARAAGAAAFLKKPFYPADIDAVLHSIYGLRGQKRAA
jgi:CheY-like chemotaxis protein